MTTAVALSELERSTGSVLGLVDTVPDPTIGAGTTARGALEERVRTALRRPPCVISFSGGRDSSAVLAVAAHVARREGLPLPVPVSLRFPDCASSEETAWQELVVRHLQLPDWQRPEFHDELDVVGPVAAQVLRDKGVLWPFNAFFHVPIMDLARGGTVLSGAGGDEIMSSGWAWRRDNLVLQRRARLQPLDPVRLLVALGPAAVRRRFLRLRYREQAPTRPAWLRPDTFAAIVRVREDVAARETVSYASSVRNTLWRMRSRVVGAASLHSIAADRDVVYDAPLAADDFLGAVVHERGWRMFASRTEAVQWLAGDLLPSEIVSRNSKAWFDTAFFNTYSRDFAQKWDGSGVDPDYVDPDELRRVWLEDEEPDARTYQLLQQAWLAAHP